MSETKWEVGMEVAIRRSWNAIPGVGKIKSIGKIHIVLENGSKYRFSGTEAGEHSYGGSSIAPMTDEIRMKILRHQRMGFIERADLKTLTDDQIVRIVAIVKEPKA
jgi:hypothetical protein